jgi:hypothetical protein
MEITRKKFTRVCEKCNFTANRPKEWIIHVDTNKHKRDGNNKSVYCVACDKTFKTHWINKMHQLKFHASIDERKKCKFYCSNCDLVFFSKLYMDKHLSGIKHKNMIDALN